MNAAPTLTADLLAKLIPMGALRPESKRDLARNATLVDAKAGSHLFQIGDRSKQALYLIEGQIELRDAGGVILGRVVGESAEARHRLPQQNPCKVDAICLTDVRCVAVDSHLLDVMLTWDQTDALQVHEVGEDASDGDDWMTRLLQTPAFQMVPPANLQAIFLRMEQLNLSPGDVVVTQGEPGDYFYVITEGRCIVTREQAAGLKAVRLAELESGSCFGEEALISDAPRNATVTMLTHGSLMRLAKADFQTLLKEPLTRRVSHGEAEAMVEAGRARYVDVRLPSEFMAGSLPAAVNVPLYMLRMRLAQLPQDRSLICVCDTGRRSSVASFVLTQKGYEAYLLDRGLYGDA